MEYRIPYIYLPTSLPKDPLNVGIYIYHTSIGNLYQFIATNLPVGHPKRPGSELNESGNPTNPQNGLPHSGSKDVS